MISQTRVVRTFPSSGRDSALNISDLKSVVSDPESEWILIAPADESNREIDSSDQVLKQSDVVWCGSDPLLAWFWRQTSPHLAASLGVTAPILVRTEKLKSVTLGERVSSEHAILLDLARSNARFAADWSDSHNDWSALGFEIRSPIPERESASPKELRKALLGLSEEELVPGAKSADDARAVKAGVLLIHDFLELSHSVSQSIEGAGLHGNGDYWHAIMHRREPDFGNSKYWFRRVGLHPVFPELASAAVTLARTMESAAIDSWVDRLTEHGWDSFVFVDFCQEMHQPDRQGSDLHLFAEKLQMIEMLLLLRQSWRDATPTAD